MEYAFEIADITVKSLETLQVAYELGRTDIIDACGGCSLDHDGEFEIGFYGLEQVADYYFASEYDDLDFAQMYFSSDNMVQYYRLCREYTQLYGGSLEQNPYMIAAKQEVADYLYCPGCYYTYYRLKTKINHKCASGILFKYAPESFYEYHELLKGLMYIFNFYDVELQSLKEDIAKKKNVLYLPLQKQERRAA